MKEMDMDVHIICSIAWEGKALEMDWAHGPSGVFQIWLGNVQIVTDYLMSIQPVKQHGKCLLSCCESVMQI